MERLVVIDTDAGVDDASAIFLVLAAHKNSAANLKIVGITCVNGNTNLDNVCKNVTRILNTSDANEIPIFRGSETGMVVPYERGPSYHGSDGFGDANLPIIEAEIKEENAILALIRLAKTFSGQLSILALGPLTNIALAARLDPSFSKHIKEICLMGGNTQPVADPTFNFKADPEAAYVTLSCFPCPITVVPYETCKRQNLKEFRVKELASLSSPEILLLNQIEGDGLKKDVWSPCDLLTAAIFIDPKLISDSRKLLVSADLVGYRGQMIINLSHPRTNVTVVDDIDVELYEQMLYWGFGGILKDCIS
ncbi:unnamed protein product [Allacma fusca]|uniref:Inosine/uridine-preferring nucleoside hydrolase domain-containing protein n=1 Tax=Allacma fusca TaxID=39272 RepID=A0A8J2PGL0_9HEXA|nr:unnamed protein product [Allacma fusca]